MMKYYFALFIFCASHTFYSLTVEPYSVIIEQRYMAAEKAMKTYETEYLIFQSLTTDGQPNPLALTDMQDAHEQHEQSMPYKDCPLRKRSTLTAIAIASHFQKLSDKILFLNTQIFDSRKSTI